MKVKLAYGRNGLVVNVPDHATVVRSRFMPGLTDEPAAIRDALRRPIASAPLAAKVKPSDRVIIVHSDITRATPNDRLLPVLLAELEAAGVRPENIALLNALGTHRPQTNAELHRILGDEVMSRYRCLQHDAWDEKNLISLSDISSGRSVRINRHYLEADVRILTGLIEPHFFAGFSGGPKGVLPAIAGFESVHSNHGFEMINHPNATWGVTAGNPIWEEMRAVALRTEPTFLLNVTINEKRQITGVFAGDLLEAHAAGCAFVKEHAMVPVSAPFDIVVTTNSGYPLDQNLYQAIKGVSAAATVVKDGGTIVLAAACEDGLPDHGQYAALLAQGKTPAGVLEMIGRPEFFAADQWTVQIQAKIQSRAKVHVYSDGLTDDQIRRAQLLPTRNIEQTISRPGQTICILPEGPQTIAYIQ